MLEFDIVVIADKIAFFIAADDTVTVTTRERSEELGLSETETVRCEGIGHDWGEPTYIWSDDYSTVTATAACARNANHVVTETVQTSARIIVRPTADNPGLVHYTAKFSSDLFTTQTRDVEIPKLDTTGHKIIVDDYTAGGKTPAAISLVRDELYSGEVKFTVACDLTCFVAVDNGDGTYTRLDCTVENGVQTFTLTVNDSDVTIAVVLSGDADLSGGISIDDVTEIISILLGRGASTENQALNMLAADADNDGRVSIDDVTELITFLLNRK